jgi:hypothetical protein
LGGILLPSDCLQPLGTRNTRLCFGTLWRRQRKTLIRKGFRGRLPTILVADGSDKTIATAGKRFDVSRFFGVIAESCANLIYAEIDAALEVHEGVFAPKAIPNFFPRHDLAGALSKKEEEAEGLWMDL